MPWNADDAVASLQTNARTGPIGKCARFVRNAIAGGGIALQQSRLRLLAHSACGLLLAAHIVGTLHASEAASPTSLQTVAALFSNALLCRTDFPDGRESTLAQRLRVSGVVALDRAPGETLDLLYVFPRPLQIEGVEIYSVIVRGSSGSVVAAHAKGDLHAFATRMQAQPHAASQWTLDGFGVLQAQYVRTMPPRIGLDETPPRLVIGRTAGDAVNTFRWGCRSYDN